MWTFLNDVRTLFSTKDPDFMHILSNIRMIERMTKEPEDDSGAVEEAA